ncbi:hypothetical protein VW29_11930 [Devosia limi DSM 17137]|uniref:Transcriptional regulator, TetR family n=1 Tax=Devosia limi DSM 17137 TaxID=1121477 RepID=A0A0F5LP10_9HYPH|nr:TetR family transcriptional regulator [Devosia limi]KKB84086.1 hypothetical protein VW29_11930 [Devosia limi DSM 17137]SHF15786.1 transcriptional regulator, TetR family [Devosia limi DSM 17137]
MTTRIKGSQQRALDTRAAILAAVTRLLAQKPFDAITIAEIAAEAGIAKGSVLAHFSEKLSILASFLADELNTTCVRLAADPQSATTPQRLAAALTPLLVYLSSDRALLRLLATDGDGTQCHDILDPVMAQAHQTLAGSFAAAGHADPSLHAEVTLAFIVHVAVSQECAAAPQRATLSLARLLGVLYPNGKSASHPDLTGGVAPG